MQKIIIEQTINKGSTIKQQYNSKCEMLNSYYNYYWSADPINVSKTCFVLVKKSFKSKLYRHLEDRRTISDRKQMMMYVRE